MGNVSLVVGHQRANVEFNGSEGKCILFSVTSGKCRLIESCEAISPGYRDAYALGNGHDLRDVSSTRGTSIDFCNRYARCEGEACKYDDVRYDGYFLSVSRNFHDSRVGAYVLGGLGLFAMYFVYRLVNRVANEFRRLTYYNGVANGVSLVSCYLSKGVCGYVIRFHGLVLRSIGSRAMAISTRDEYMCSLTSYFGVDLLRLLRGFFILRSPYFYASSS